jgi:hypothetical protein
MIRQLQQRKFVNLALELMSIRYNENRKQLNKLIHNTSIPDPVCTFLNLQQYVYNEENTSKVKILIQEQIKINKMIIIGRNMLKT